MKDYTEKLSHILKRAVEEANLSTHTQKVGCVIFKGKRIIASAHNSVRANKIPNKFKNFYESSHAEAKAIIDAKRDLRGYSMLVVRQGKDKLLLAKPCEFCQGFIDHVSFSKVFYSTNDSTIVCD